MKTIYLLRHAKATKNLFYTQDFDRPLSKTGNLQMYELHKNLQKHKIKLDACVCSPSIRTSQTAILFFKLFSLDYAKILWQENLYLGDLNDYYQSISSLDDSIKTCMLVGHNPTIEFLSNKLLQEESTEEYATGQFNMISLDIESWKSIKKASGKLIIQNIPTITKI